MRCFGIEFNYWNKANDIRVRTTFPDSPVQALGMFYNGRVSRVDVAIVNKEPDPITVQLIGGAFQDIATLKPIQNVHIRSTSNLQ